jgi:response regulator RpfG family c-di-GMP phosphodiesterase
VAPKHVLVVDDDDAVCDLIRAALELEGFEVSDARHVIEAEGLIEKRVPDAILLDIGLPGIDGLFYCARLREKPRTRDVPIIVISGSIEAAVQAKEAGATAYLRKPLDPLELLALLQRSLGATPLAGVGGESPAETTTLNRLLAIGQRAHEVENDAHRQTLLALSAALDSRDFGESGHSERVTAYAVRLALEVEPSLTDDPSLEWGFLLHDVGMIGIPDQILLKPGRLTPEERAEMERHPVLGEQLLAGVPLLQGEGLRVVRSHHERWDGKGYPDRLGAAGIPTGARIFAVADALDAMTSSRPYRETVSWDAALAELRAQTGSQFDPDVIDSLLVCEPDLEAIRRRPSAQLLSAAG